MDFDIAALAAFLDERRQKALTIDVKAGDLMGDEAQALLVPAGFAAVPTKPILDAFRTRPERREGVTPLTTLESFIRWTNRHRDTSSVVFAVDEMAKPSLTAVIDHDEEGAEDGERARYGRHRATYAFPLSREWQAWMAIDKKALAAADFAEFFEVRIADVLPPPTALLPDNTTVSAITDPEVLKLVATLGRRLATPTEIVELTRGIAINVDATAKVAINRDTGEHFVEYSEANGVGVERTKPPNLFLIAVPVFRGADQPTMIAVHLRYRAVGGKVFWTMEVHQPERVFEVEFARALGLVKDGTTIEPLRGAAPSAR